MSCAFHCVVTASHSLGVQADDLRQQVNQKVKNAPPAAAATQWISTPQVRSSSPARKPVRTKQNKPFAHNWLSEPCHYDHTPTKVNSPAWGAGLVTSEFSAGVSPQKPAAGSPVRQRGPSPPKKTKQEDWDKTNARFVAHEKLRQDGIRQRRDDINVEEVGPGKPVINAHSRKLVSGQLPIHAPERWNQVIQQQQENREQLTERVREETAVERKTKSTGSTRSRADMMQWQQARDAKVQRARQAKLEEELEELSAAKRSHLTRNSKKIVQRMPGMQSNQDVGSRLYGDAAQRRERREQLKQEVEAGQQAALDSSFSPIIAAGSQKIIAKQAHRTEVSTRLYSDAMRRKGRQSTKQPAASAEPVELKPGEPLMVSQPPSRHVPQQVRDWLLVAEEDSSGQVWFVNSNTNERHPQFPGPQDAWKVFFESDSQTCFYHNTETGDSNK